MGVNNLAACTSNVINSFIINGRPIKSINQYYNKKSAKLQSNLELINKTKTSKKLRLLSLKRNNKIKWYLHHSSKYIIDICVQNNINTIIIGKNDGWKQNINIGVKNNQTFVSIPFNILVQQIKYKGKLKGINIIEQEESYTSKVSFLDDDFIPVYGKSDNKFNPSGKRINRGLYQTKENHYINADINGSLNILRKYLNVASNSIIGERSRGFVVNPYIIIFK
jgi:putative transposase